jgi:hypothetical protein
MKFYAVVLVQSAGPKELDVSAHIQDTLLPSPKTIKLVLMIMISIIIEFICIQ